MKLMALSLSAAFLAGCATAAPGDSRSEALKVPSAETMNQFLYSVMAERGGDIDTALDALEKAAGSADDPLPLQMRLITRYYQLQRYEDALRVAEQAAKDNTGEPMVWTLLGRIYERLGRDAEATEAYTRASQMDNASSRSLQEVVSAHLRSNDIVAAVEVYERMLAMDPENPDLYFRYGRILMEMNDYEAAQKAFEKTIELDPEMEPANAQLAIALLLQDKFAKAEPYLRQMADRAQDYPMAPKLLAACISRQGRMDEAIVVLAQRMADGVASGEERVALVYLAYVLGHYEAALSVVPPDDAPMYATLMRMLVRKAKGEAYEPLRETFDEIESDMDLELDTHFSEVALFIGEEGFRDRFIPAVEAVRGDGDSKSLEHIYAYLLASADLEEQAEKAYLNIIEKFGDDFLAHNQLALIYESRNDYASAEKHLRACLALEEDDHNMMNTLGYLLAEADTKLEEAEDLLEKALSADPNNGFYLDSLGWIYYRMGDAEKAIDLIQRAIVRMERDDAILRDHLGDAYLLNGEVDKAVEQWRKAYRLNPDHEGLAEKLERHGEQ